MTKKLEQAAREVIRQHSMECLSDKTVDALREALAEPDIEEMTLTQIAAKYEQAEQEPVAEALRLSEEAIEYARQGGKVGSGIYGKALAAIRSAKEPQITTPDVCGEVCARAKLCYGCNKDLEEANAKHAEQAEKKTYPVRRGSRITCVESGEHCVVWATSHTDCWVQFPDGHAGQYTYEQIGSYFSLDENYATDEAYERGLKEGIEAGKKIAEQAEQEPVLCVECGKPTMHIGNKCYACCQKDTKDLEDALKSWDAEPARTKDLTDYEIDCIRFNLESGKTWIDFARAVMAKYKEKNK